MKLRITLEGKSYDVEVEMIDDLRAAPAPAPAPVAAAAPPPPPPPSAPAPSAVTRPMGTGGKTIAAPIVGTVLSVKVKPGDAIGVNQVVAVMEAMKMETNVASPIAGTVKAVNVKAGEPVKAGQVLVELE